MTLRRLSNPRPNILTGAPQLSDGGPFVLSDVDVNKVKVCIFGQGFVANVFEAGLARIRTGEIEPHGVPLGRDLPIPIEDIEVAAAFEVDPDKVGRTAHDVARRYMDKVPRALPRIPVLRGVHLGSLEGTPVHAEGLDRDRTLAECADTLLKEYGRLGPDVFLNLCTTERSNPIADRKELFRAIEEDRRGALTASQFYFFTVLQYARSHPAAFVNCIPTSIANEPVLAALAAEAGVPLFGDDGASGATPLTSDLLEHLRERNRLVTSIAQFNIGGNFDFLALTDPGRNLAKEATKSTIVRDILGYDVPHYMKPTGYLAPLGDRKFVAMHLPYRSFNEAEDEIMVLARINDSPALAGLAVDLVRLARLCLDRGIFGAVYPVNAFYMKNPGPAGKPAIARIAAYSNLREWLGRSATPIVADSRATEAPTT